jgi:predicted ATPase
MARNPVDHITIVGFKSIRSIKKLHLPNVNLLIETNGTGKSNFIEVFSFLASIIEGRLQQYVRRAGGAEQLLYFGSKVTNEIAFHLSFSEQVNGYRLALKPTDQDTVSCR